MSAGIMFNVVYTYIGQPINPMCDVTIECDITPPFKQKIQFSITA